MATESWVSTVTPARIMRPGDSSGKRALPRSGEQAVQITVPAAPPAAERIPFNWHIIHASIELVSATLHIRRLFLAILSISFFWTIGAVLIIIFPPLVKNVLGADEQVASLFIAIFSIGIAIGSVAINRLLNGLPFHHLYARRFWGRSPDPGEDETDENRGTESV